MGGLSAEQDRLRVITLIGVGALIVLNGADVVTTHLLLVHGAQEANPLSSVLPASASLLWVKLAILGALGVMVIRHRPRFGVMAAVFVTLGMYATAVLSNLLVLRLVTRQQPRPRTEQLGPGMSQGRVSTSVTYSQSTWL
jgi:hypothetical protein